MVTFHEIFNKFKKCSDPVAASSCVGPVMSVSQARLGQNYSQLRSPSSDSSRQNLYIKLPYFHGFQTSGDSILRDALHTGQNNIATTRRNSPLHRLTSSSCGGLRPKLCFPFEQKKSFPHCLCLF